MSKSGRLYMDKLEEAHAMIQELVDALEGARWKLNSIGEPTYSGEDIDSILKYIDAALSKAKGQGK